MKIKRKDAAAIIESLSGGVVPRRGLNYIMVGRIHEARQIEKDLKSVKEGASMMKLFIGDFGSGKSFIQGLIKQISFQNNFVTTKADFSPEKRLYGENRAIALYTELIKNLSTNSSPEGGALPEIIERWITQIQSFTSEETNMAVDFTNQNFIEAVEERITEEIAKIDVLSGGYDFSKIMNIYYQGFVENDSEKKRKSLRWMRGEYPTKTEAKNDLGASDIINDGNYYNYIKVLSQFVKQVGYSGLVVNLDEAINLYKITHQQAREKNYETILTMYNDCLQGNLEGLYITVGGTPEFLTNERRGLYSYGALKSRLEVNQFETKEYRDLTQPVIHIFHLQHEELFVLLKRLRDIHAIYFNYVPHITEQEIKSFIVAKFSVPGAEEYTTIRHVIKAFMDVLNIMEQNPAFDKAKVFGNISEDPPAEKQVPSRDQVMDRFSST